MTKARVIFARFTGPKVSNMSLKIEQLSRQGPDGRVLRDVSFTVERGEVFGVLSVNGGGKTKLLKTLAGLETFETGNIFLDGKPFKADRENNPYFPSSEKKKGLTGLFSSGDDDSVSNGRKIRDGLTDALENASDVLLLDDPFVCLDPQNKREMGEMVRETARAKNLSIVFATNDYREIFEVCDRAGVLYNGELIQTGTPAEIYRDPQTSAVARIFGENNLFEARRLTSTKNDAPEFFTIEGEQTISTARIPKERLGPINQTITLAVRPEHISISFGASFPEDNLLKATVTGINFRGSTTLIELDANGLKLNALVLRLVGLNVGDECMVGLPPDRIAVLKS
jgi:ABC-type Fe3+/spermidine/putrescine transport system ATPase subunit